MDESGDLDACKHTPRLVGVPEFDEHKADLVS
jgi:hypothetical protein